MHKENSTHFGYVHSVIFWDWQPYLPSYATTTLTLKEILKTNLYELSGLVPKRLDHFI